MIADWMTFSINQCDQEASPGISPFSQTTFKPFIVYEDFIYHLPYDLFPISCSFQANILITFD